MVLTGTGDRAFCAGMDLRGFAEGGSGGMSGNPDGMHGFARFTQGEIGVPIVGAANATAVAGGFELLLGCDVVVASEAASFGLPEVKRGLFAAGGGVFVSTRIPLAVALELTLTGDSIDAGRALSLGLINQVVAPAQVLDAAVALAERIARNGPLALQATKQLVRTASTDLEQGPDAGGGVAAEGVRQRGRQGGCHRLHREARPGVEGSLSARVRPCRLEVGRWTPSPGLRLRAAVCSGSVRGRYKGTVTRATTTSSRPRNAEESTRSSWLCRIR